MFNLRNISNVPKCNVIYYDFTESKNYVFSRNPIKNNLCKGRSLLALPIINYFHISNYFLLFSLLTTVEFF